MRMLPPPIERSSAPLPRPRANAHRYDRDYLLECAATLLGEADASHARHLYAYLLKQDPDDGAALRGLGLCLLAAGNVSAAKRCFQALAGGDAEGFGDEHAERNFLLGRCFAAEGDWERATEAFRRVGRPERLATPVAAALWRELGECLLRSGKWADAASCFDRAFPIVPDAVPLHLSYGYLEYKRGDLGAAETHYRRAIGLDSECRKARAGLGIVAHARGDYATAGRELFLALGETATERASLAPLQSLGERRRPDAATRRILSHALEQAKQLLALRR